MNNAYTPSFCLISSSNRPPYSVSRMLAMTAILTGGLSLAQMASALPDDAEEGDYVLFPGLGAYSTATLTRFNGYGHFTVITVESPV